MLINNQNSGSATKWTQLAAMRPNKTDQADKVRRCEDLKIFFCEQNLELQIWS